MRTTGAVFQPELIELMRAVLDDATAMLPGAKRTSSMKAEIASHILACAANGERNPLALKATALLWNVRTTLTTSALSAGKSDPSVFHSLLEFLLRVVWPSPEARRGVLQFPLARIWRLIKIPQMNPMSVFLRRPGHGISSNLGIRLAS
jgi:hypothetical protein